MTNFSVISSDNAIQLPTGPTGYRPLTPDGGMLRFNTDTNKLEYYDGTNWDNIGLGSVTQINTGTGLTGGPITTSGTISLANMAADTIKANPTGSPAAPQDVTIGSTLTFSGTTLETTAGTGDVTWSTNSFATTIANNAVTYAKFQQVAADSVVGNNTGSPANAISLTPSQVLDIIGSTQGDILYRDVSGWQVLAPGTSGQVLSTQGTGANPQWITSSSGVSSVFGRTGAVVSAAGDYDVTQIYKEKFHGGRLTLVSGTPILTANESAQTTIYYTPYISDLISIYDGTRYVTYEFSEVSVTLDTLNFLSGNLYDLFMYNDSGTLRLGYGPAWSTSTSRGTGSGTTQIQMIQGMWSNQNSITLRYDNSHTTSVGVNQATYVGTVYAVANGQTSMEFNLAPVANGNDPVLGLWNAYNRSRVSSTNQNKSDWSYSSNTWRFANNQSNNRVRYIDGLAQSSIEGSYTNVGTNGNPNYGVVGIERDWTGGSPTGISPLGEAYYFQISAVNSWNPSLGLHEIDALEYTNNGGSTSFIGSAAAGQCMGLYIRLDM